MGIRLSLLVLLVGVAGCGGAGPPIEPGAALPSATAPLPDVQLLTEDRRKIRLARVVQGRPALINLWATWCEACEQEFDALNRLHEQVAAHGLVVGVAVGEPHDQVVSFARRRGLRYRQLIDEDFAFADALGSQRIPTTLVVDRDGSLLLQGAALDASTLAAFGRALEGRAGRNAH